MTSCGKPSHKEAGCRVKRAIQSIFIEDPLKAKVVLTSTQELSGRTVCDVCNEKWFRQREQKVGEFSMPPCKDRLIESIKADV